VKQTRIDSLMEVLTGTAIGLLVSTVANFLWFPVLHGIPMSLAFNIATGAFFTVISVARSYAIRRLFNGRTPWVALKSLFIKE
jgi:hypothetical protein